MQRFKKDDKNHLKWQMRCVIAGKVFGLLPGGLLIFKTIGICLESEEILIYINGIPNPHYFQCINITGCYLL